MADDPGPLTDAVQKMKRDRVVMRGAKFIANLSIIPSLLVTFGLGACAFAVGMALGYVALRDTSEGAGFALGVVLGLGAAFGAVMGSFWALNRARQALVDHVEDNAETSSRRAADLQSKIEANPNLADASAGLSITRDASSGALSSVGQAPSKAMEASTASQPLRRTESDA